MAGLWIKIEHVTPGKPEIFMISEYLNLDPDNVLGKMIRLWIWADQQTVNGNAGNVTKALLDHVAGVTGFADAMIKTGWLSLDKENLVFTNFQLHNGAGAKKRILGNERVKRHRNATSVTKALPDVDVDVDVDVDKDVDLEEKNIKDHSPSKIENFIPPTISEIEEYIKSHERNYWTDKTAEQIMAHYENLGWKDAKGKKVKNWKNKILTVWLKKKPVDYFEKELNMRNED